MADPRRATRPTIESVTDRLVNHVAPLIDDLAREDPATAVEVHFEPIKVRSLPASDLTTGDCSIDGYYEANLDPTRPWILYADDVNPARARFTILHELGHHLLATTAADLLDDLDRIGGSPAGSIRAEEAVCHRFAGRVLIPEAIVDSTVDRQALRPHHVIDLKESSNASWEAVAVRAAEAAATKTVVVLIRTPGEIAFTATSARVGHRRWPRFSQSRPDGPLARALDTDHQRAIKDIFLWNLPYAEQLYCDTVRVHDQLAIAVLSDRPSDGRFDILDDVEPAWSDREEFCSRCGDERDTGWCDTCRGRKCRSCGSCGCNQPIENPLCLRCFLHNAFNPGATMCRDCERDGG